MKKRIFAVFFVNALIVAMVGIAFGISSYLSQFNTQYGTSATALNTCTLCHLSSPATASNLNPYGNDFAANGHNYAAIEALAANLPEEEGRRYRASMLEQRFRQNVESAPWFIQKMSAIELSQILLADSRKTEFR